MRISDWSSDVCSSDLACARFAREYGEPGVELYFGLFDDNKIAYMQGTQHMLFDLVGRLRHVVPVQLAAQGGEEAVAGRMNETNRILCPTHLDAIAGLAVGPGLHVEVDAGARLDPAQSGDCKT